MRERPASVRHGVVLLVVMSLLVLFAIVGISFVIYAEAQASTARARKESEDQRRPDMDPEELLAYFLGQLIYDTNNPHSALRGHGLARNMYGRPGNHVPFSGTGRARGPDYQRINYQAFGGAPRNPDDAGSPNPPYTYPDINHPFLAAIRGSDGAVLIQSYQRHAHTGFSGDWNDASMRDRVLTPLPGDHRGFPAPEDEGGHVKNLADSPGYLTAGGTFAANDSYWIDAGHPVMRALDGRKFKPLFAPLIIDLDSRLNVNVHGNIRGSTKGDVSGGLDPRQGRTVSDQGLGPWEVNPRHVIWARDTLDGQPDPSGHWEMRRLFIGNLDGSWNQTVRGRYDIMYPSGTPPAGRKVGRWGEAGHALPDRYAIRGPNYAPINGDANHPGMGTTMPGQGGGANSRGTSFCPYYNGNFDGWSQGSAGRNHPLLYNFFMPTDSYYTLDTTGLHFGVSNMEALLRYGDSGSPALTSDLFFVCPISFGDPVRGGMTRRLVTTHSFDVDSPGVVPFLHNGPSYRLAAGDDYPRGDPLTTPSLSGGPPPQSEYDGQWQAATARIGRINLNRDLPRGSMGNAEQERTFLPIDETASYPQLRNGRIDAKDFAQFQRATQARQAFARELFELAWRTTGAQDPARAAPGTPEFDALRWLAQLSVNIVDFIDIDDYLTPFEWRPGEYVFGCELPRIVLNEVYAEKTDNDKVNFWIELHNPHYNGGQGGQGNPMPGVEGNAARLQVGRPRDGSDPSTDWACYKIVISTPPDPQRLRDPANTRGEPDPASVKLEVASYEPDDPTQPAIPVGDGTGRDGTNFVRPNAADVSDSDRDNRSRDSNEGMYVLGPKDDFPADDPGNKPAGHPDPTLRVKDQTINGKQSALSYTENNLPADVKHTILLRRLACPYLPPQEDPSQPNYNPYVTVDYLDEVPTNNGAGGNATPVEQRYSVGRAQPYAAHPSQLKDQKPAAALSDQPQHTFFKVNEQGGPRRPFDWLVFCDRPLISPMELLNVSAYPPHRLTQQFITGDLPEQRFTHRAPWYDDQARIFRMLEFCSATSMMQWVPVGGRSTGQMNINTMWDRPLLHCLGDAQPNNFFTQADVDRFFEKMVRSRTPGAVVVNGQVEQANIGPGDRPFLGFAAAQALPGDPQYPNGSGIDDTLLRADPEDMNPVPPAQKRRLFEPDVPHPRSNGHPYIKEEFLRKVFNSFTTRSNVFAVWLTVGFFEVVDDSDPSRPPVLGPEIGKAEGRHVRHRMFAIIDRTNLTLDFDPATRQILSGQPGPRPFFLPSHTAVAQPGPATIRVPCGRGSTASEIRGNYEGFTWSIRRGDHLVADCGQNLEVIRVDAIRMVSLGEAEIDAAFAKPHPARFALSNAVLGNPGPQPRFDPRNPKFQGVVRFMSIVE